jgi:glycosyltransferase involved in cell wall biosynthesis
MVIYLAFFYLCILFLCVMRYYSVIIPVYNRPQEVEELLESLSGQSDTNFEVVIVEDGSTHTCRTAVEKFADKLSITYHAKPNTGRSDSRNTGMRLAKGNYFIFFDSDCIIPAQYFVNLTNALNDNYCDCFGGPDKAHESFSDIQKAINFAMTSFYTTGGIRGGKRNMETFKPRTFNMGFSREVYEKTGEFKHMLGEDIDLSIRIARAGFRISLYHDVYVYHKRRISFTKFYKQVYNFGIARINLALLHKKSLKLIHALPFLFLAGGLVVLGLSVALSPWFLLLPAGYTLLLFVDALRKTGKINTSFLALWASYIQITAYGCGFTEAFVKKVILRKGLEKEEVLKRIYK